MNIMYEQIINLFTDPIKTMNNGYGFQNTKMGGEYIN